jgi:hypothetical protein
LLRSKIQIWPIWLLCLPQEHFSNDMLQQLAKLCSAADAPVFMTGNLHLQLLCGALSMPATLLGL